MTVNIQSHSSYSKTELRPQGINGQMGTVYQLNANSVSPQVVTGRDELGQPIIETIPTVYYRIFLTMDGCENRVPMRTGSGNNMEPEAVRYEHQQTKELIEAGWIPVEVCPYTHKFEHYLGGAFVKVPDGERDCGGKPDGCDHLKKVAAGRKAIAHKKWEAQNKSVQSMKAEDVSRMMESVAEGVGVAIANHMGGKQSASARMRDGKGE